MNPALNSNSAKQFKLYLSDPQIPIDITYKNVI